MTDEQLQPDPLMQAITTALLEGIDNPIDRIILYRASLLAAGTELMRVQSEGAFVDPQVLMTIQQVFMALDGFDVDAIQERREELLDGPPSADTGEGVRIIAEAPEPEQGPAEEDS